MARVLVALVGMTMSMYVGSSSAGAMLPPTTRVPHPVALQLTYGRFDLSKSWRSGFALRLQARQPRGQIVEIHYQELNNRDEANGVGGDALSRCGLGGRRNGRIETFWLPLAKALGPGRHCIRITVYGSLCRDHSRVRSSSRLFTLSA
jgi:hypothetical protein